MATFSAFWALAHAARGATYGPSRPPPLNPPVASTTKNAKAHACNVFIFVTFAFDLLTPK